MLPVKYGIISLIEIDFKLIHDKLPPTGIEPGTYYSMSQIANQCATLPPVSPLLIFFQHKIVNLTPPFPKKTFTSFQSKTEWF